MQGFSVFHKKKVSTNMCGRLVWLPGPPHLPVFDCWQYAKIPQAMKTGQWEGLGMRLAEVTVHAIPLVQVVVIYVTC